MPLTITSQTGEFISLDEVKEHLNIAPSVTDHDTELVLIASAAQELVEGIVGPVLHREVVQVDRSLTSSVVLSSAPVVSITSVAYDSVAYLSPVTVDAEAGIVSGLSGGDNATITYVAGRAECPDAIRLAALIVAAHLWRTQLGNAPSGALPQSDDFPQGPFGVGFAIPSRAMDLLSPYALTTGVA